MSTEGTGMTRAHSDPLASPWEDRLQEAGAGGGGSGRGCGVFPAGRRQREGGDLQLPSCRLPRGRKPVGTTLLQFGELSSVSHTRSPRQRGRPCLFMKSISFGKSMTATAVCTGAVTQTRRDITHDPGCQIRVSRSNPLLD